MGYRVLIAEDEDLIRRGILCSMDWNKLNCTKVEEAADGQQALDLIQEREYHIVLLDINMPVLDGLTVLERTWESRNYVPIILSGYAEFTYAQKAIAFRADSYLLKPVNFRLLHDAILRAQKEWERRAALSKDTAAQFQLSNILPLVNSGHGEPVQKMLDYIRDHYAQRITITDMAWQLHYSETFLIRLFGREMGMKFTDYLNRYRIREAIPLILDPANRISEVAERCGFSDYKYFNAVFKKYLGCSVREFREQMRAQP